ncbi:hypothetical protein F7725_020278 [Dissostichus mawsoni]|uniref:DDE Tnp4 domain-containing protein n=1 Tax=Dissostichus mawsoni TaxID=36200 RepID=A0A7J5YCU4_DISMA|nr:hypothetical protein F7725_020278 [Dissostichus mawsoni]
MSRDSLVALTEKLRQYIERQTTNMRAPIDPLKRVALILYYLSDGGSLRKTANAFGVSRQALSVIIRQTCRAISIHLGPKYIKLPFAEPETADLAEGFDRAHRMPQFQEQYFGITLYSARMVIECAFGRLKARFAALRRPMDINLDDLPHVIYSCFVLHHFCEPVRRLWMISLCWEQYKVKRTYSLHTVQ